MSSTRIPDIIHQMFPTGGVSKDAARQRAISEAEGDGDEEAEVRELVNARIKYIRAGDVAGATSNAVQNVVVFDVIDAFAQEGIEVMRERASTWFNSFQGPIGVDVRDLAVSVSGGAAFVHSLNRYFGKLKSGGDLNMYVRVTLCLRKIDGRWMITHEHNSVPFDSKTGLAMISPVSENSGGSQPQMKPVE